MSVKIRLSRHGAKKRPFYRVVAADINSPRDGRFLEIVGTYDPTQKPSDIQLKGERVKYWLSKGALPTKTVAELIQRSGVLNEQPEAAEGPAS
jgi:small subunit ribosomal protein S16